MQILIPSPPHPFGQTFLVYLKAHALGCRQPLIKGLLRLLGAFMTGSWSFRGWTLGVSGACWGLLGLLGDLGVVLGSHGAVLGRRWGRLEALLGLLGAILGLS